MKNVNVAINVKMNFYIILMNNILMHVLDNVSNNVCVKANNNVWDNVSINVLGNVLETKPTSSQLQKAFDLL